LGDLMKAQGCGYIPDVIQKSLDFLNQYQNEPLFSKQGNMAEVREIIGAYDQGSMTSLHNFTSDPFTICSLLLEFLDCLPEPLLTTKLFPNFLELSHPESLKALRNICDTLPEYNHALAECIFQFLNECCKKGVKVDDLSVFGPIVLKKRDGSQTLEETSASVKFLVQNVDYLFGILKIHNLTDTYNVTDDLGSGAYAVAKKIVHKETGETYAVKIIQKKHLEKRERDRLTMETNILKRVRHPNIIALKAVCETDDELFLIMELAEGGELFEHIVNQGAYSEDVAIDITKQIVSAVSYLHDMNIVHRDIKPENILLKKKGTLELKLADFGLSKMFDATVRMQTTCGSPGYVAPEVLTDDLYGREVDMWSVGVIAYVLLSGFPPFYSENIKELFQQIMIAKYDFPPQYWDSVSESAKDFVRRLLVRNPGSRMSAAQALEHRWLVGNSVPHGSLTIAGNMKATHDREKEQQKKVDDEVRNKPKKKVREVTGVEHTFKPHTYYKPTWCELCDDFLWGIHHQGYQCKKCKMDVHKHCRKVTPKSCDP
jgi:calcium/calmodulin-dependent protein kinase I